MKIPDIGLFIEESREALLDMLENLKDIKPLDTSIFDKNETALVIIDMVNGFAKAGSLSSPRVEAIIPDVRKSALLCRERGFEIIAFADCHCKDSAEFSFYPVHCLEGSYESELIDELKDIIDIKKINKNSTNGFLAEGFQTWLKSSRIKNFIVIGDCTDICVMQFILSLKTYFNNNNNKVNIYIALDSVETFDLGSHKGDLMNVLSLFIMESNGAVIVSEIK